MFLGVQYAQPPVGDLRFKFGCAHAGTTPDVAAPKDLLTAGKYNALADILVGSNARELGLFQQAGSAPVANSIAELNAVIDATFGPAAGLVKQQYTAANDTLANATLIRLGTDLLFRCPTRAFARRTSRQGNAVYLYHFEEGAAFHAFELPYVFGIPNALLGAPTLVEPLRAYVQTTFTNFARDGVPVSTPASGLPEWPRYLTDSDRHIVLKRDVIASANLSKADCDFLEQIGAVQ